MKTSSSRYSHGLRTVVFLALALAAPTLRAQDLALRTLVKEQSIGSVGSSSDYLFSTVVAILPAANGSVVVADSRQRAIRRFGRDGRFERSIGRDGGGPGEFRSLTRIGMLGDTLWLLDEQLRRTSLYSESGTLVSTSNWAAQTPGREGVNTVSGLLAGGVSWGENDASTARALVGEPGGTKAVVRMSRAGETQDTITFVETANTYLSIPIPGQGFNIGRQPFADAPIVVGAPDRSRVYVVNRSASQSRRNARVGVVAFTPSGDTLWSHVFPVELRALNGRTRDSVVQRFVRSTQRSQVPEKVIRESLFLPENRPPVSAAFVATEGALWLQRETGQEETAYWIVSPEGQLQGKVVVPSSVTLMAARGAHVWGVERDDDDVPSVVRWRVEP